MVHLIVILRWTSSSRPATAVLTVGRPRLLDSITFDDWLADALTDGQQGQYVDDSSTVNEYARRFNTDIASIVELHGETAVNKAIWYIYGSASGYMWDAMDSSLGTRRFEFMTSVRDLYALGFAPFCSKHLGHLDRGPEPSRPMNSACYMLWDMDGIECPAINGDADMLDASIDVLSFALKLDNWACQESALHGVGHLAMSSPQKTTPLIRNYLRRKDIPAELRHYANTAQSGCVL